MNQIKVTQSCTEESQRTTESMKNIFYSVKLRAPL